MLKREIGILKNRPYFGGEKSEEQIRGLDEIRLHEYLIIFNVDLGAYALVRVVKLPYSMNGSWQASFQEIGAFGRANSPKEMDLSGLSVVPYKNGAWEGDWCLIKTKFKDPEKLSIDMKRYQPIYY